MSPIAADEQEWEGNRECIEEPRRDSINYILNNFSKCFRISRLILMCRISCEILYKMMSEMILPTNSMGSGASKYEKLMKNGHWNFQKIITGTMEVYKLFLMYFGDAFT